MLRYLFILIICCSIKFSSAQENQLFKTYSPYYIKHYTLDDGLSQVTINDIVEDEEGFLWLATQDGLNRFDGSSFTVFHSGTKNTNSLQDNFINVLLADQNKIWIGTRSSGLSYFDYQKFLFVHFKKFSTYEIKDIKRDFYNHIFVALEKNGLAVLTSDGDSYRQERIDFFSSLNLTTTSIHISKSGIIWIGTKKGRIFYAESQADIKNLNFKEYYLPNSLMGKINIINSNSSDIIWIGTQNQLYQLQLKTDILSPFYYFKKEMNKSIIIYDLKWKNESLWISTGNGLYEFEDRDNGNMVNLYEHEALNSYSLSNNVVTSIHFDSNDQVWVGTGKYLNLFYKNQIIHTIRGEVSNPNSLNSNIIFSILKDDTNLWIGTSGGGINLLQNDLNFVFTKYLYDLPSNTIFSMMNCDNNLWVGTKEGLVILDKINKHPKAISTYNVFYHPNDPNSLSNNFIRDIYKDPEKHIWICTYEGGLNRFTGDITKHNFQFEHYSHNPKNSNSISSDKVYCIKMISDGNYWIGTDKGLSILSFSNTNFEHPVFNRLTINSKNILDSNTVIYNILEDSSKDVWIGTTKGLYKYISKTKKIILYNEEDGMLNSIIYGLLEDFQHNIWVSTNKGLSVFDKDSKSFINYTTKDGLSNQEYNLQAAFIDTYGTLYFGGINGIDYFNPKELSRLGNEDGTLFLKNIQTTDQKQQEIKTNLITSNTALRIKSKQFPFYVNFSDINLNYYKNINFAYRLKPDDTRWNYIQDKRQIQFLNLASGNYTLEIQGVTKGKVWQKSKPLSLPITVIPFWWQSQWAYLVYALLFFAIIYTIYHSSLKRKLEHQENLRLLELDELKTKLYGNITHELRTPLTVIMGMTDGIQTKMTPKELKKFKPKLTILSRNTKKLLLLINQMLDLSKIESGKMELEQVQADIIPFIKVNLDSFHSLSSHKNIELIYYNEDDKILMDFDPDKISIIVSNLLSNAIKFTPEKGRIIFHIKKITKHNNPYLLLKIKDNGIGISDEDQKYIFDRFYQADILSSSGTGIGLSLIKEIISLMKGYISVKSKLHQGTEFTIEIPITNLAKKAAEVEVNPLYFVNDNDQKELEKKDLQQEELPLLLIIEDNIDVANFIASGLIQQYEIIFAQDGKEGIEKAFEKIPDLIISDLMMPNIDGFKVCTILKNDEKTSHIPIIMLTARTLEKDKIKGLAHGADAYLTKPFNKNELLVRVEQLILLRKRMHEKYQKIGFSITETNSKEVSFINKCIKLIHEHLDDDHFKSAQLSFAVHLSESQLYRKIKAITNLSTAVFIRDVRLSAGKEMLQKTEMNISEISYACGFSNPDWFSKSFKEKFGDTPSAYRKSL